MHEWSLAQAVVNAVADHCVRNNARKVEAIVVLGELQQIDVSVFKLALKEILEAQGMRKIRIKIEHQQAVFKCRACGFQWSFSRTKKSLQASDAELIHFIPEVSHAYIRCPKCKSPDFEIVRGRGLWIKEIKEM
jgi:hydrogenase nickel incorporation protein HypA/HybF